MRTEFLSSLRRSIPGDVRVRIRIEDREELEEFCGLIGSKITLEDIKRKSLLKRS